MFSEMMYPYIRKPETYIQVLTYYSQTYELKHIFYSGSDLLVTCLFCEITFILEGLIYMAEQMMMEAIKAFA